MCPLTGFPRWLTTSSTSGLQAGFQTLIEKNILKSPFKRPQPPTSLSLPESIFPKPLEILIIKTSGACGTPSPQLPEISSLSQLPVNFQLSISCPGKGSCLTCEFFLFRNLHPPTGFWVPYLLELSWWLRWQGICLYCKRPGFNSWIKRSPGEGNGNPLQYSCLESSMDRGAWWGHKESDMSKRLTL